MAHDGRVVGQVTKLVRLDQKFLHALITVCGMILMDGPRRTLNPVFAERVRATERIGFGCGAIHEKVFQIEREDFGLLFRLGRNERFEGLSRNNQHQHTIAQPVDDVEITGSIVARRNRILELIADEDELVECIFLVRRERVAAEGVPVEQQFCDGEDVLALGRIVLGNVDAEDFSLVHVGHGAGVWFVRAKDFGDFRRAEVFEIVQRGADFTSALLLRLVIFSVGFIQEGRQLDAAVGRVHSGQSGEG